MELTTQEVFEDTNWGNHIPFFEEDQTTQSPTE
jgi:hypothetical protein